MILINGEEYKCKTRSGKEVQVQLYNITYADVELIFPSSDDIMALIMLNEQTKIKSLHIKYLPYARQDRACSGEGSSLRAFAKIINSLEIPAVYLYNPHSKESELLVNNCYVFEQHELCYDIVTRHSNAVLIAPDKGASIKVKKSGCNTVMVNKIRNEDGSIRSITVNDDVKGRDCLVLDDICDGGRTFIAVAEELKKAGANKLYLYTTYGIYAHGYLELLKYYEKLYYNWSKKPIPEDIQDQVEKI